MKIILLCLAFLLNFSSCQKEYCWKCNVRVRIFQNSTTPTESNSVTQVCGKTEDEINDYEKDGTRTTQSTSNGATITIITQTTCDR